MCELGLKTNTLLVGCVAFNWVVSMAILVPGAALACIVHGVEKHLQIRRQVIWCNH